MKSHRTLNQFIDEQITKFEIPDTEQNQKRLRAKFMRVLKELNFWDNAETRIVGKSKTKVFTQDQLLQLYLKVENYLIKHSTIDEDDLAKYISEATAAIQNYHDTLDKTPDELLKKEEEQKYEPPKISTKTLNHYMLKALFEVFYEPFDITQWNKDLAEYHFTDIEDIDTVNYYLVQKRLNDPISAYTKLRKEQ
ncbi:hypothetical protein [Streptococcus sp. sy004]|uniref:hypothetical protein n=1 Tax=Streptococcus sp. sy004 TaxID=2600149 RepID=UPI0011B5C6E4|nr:hypothetical protein [Streptococcus sp. sy004]TWT09772.1 hypothetical protein FRX54_06235 [Streptococcus sp. sy004]